MCVVMKIESHNHPSAIEPYQGAATGVGGIVRDIFAMGARPIALLDSLRFGPIAPTDGFDPDTVARNRYLFRGVVSGIGGYGNCLGIPTVGGEVVFEDAYAGNPLVNAMCVGIAPIDKLVSAKAEGVGNVLMLVGADTGRDGIHGASGLASRTDPNARFEETAPRCAGRQPLPREDAPRGLPRSRTEPRRLDHRHPGPRRRRPDVFRRRSPPPAAAPASRSTSRSAHGAKKA